MTDLLTAHNLTKQFGRKAALDNINFTLTKGKILGLLGPNGSGKTTLIKLINGLLKPTNGEILINGYTPCAETKAIVSYLPDTTYINDNLKVTQIIKFFEDFYQDFDKQRALQLLHDLDIDASQKMKNLSKGTKEKVQLILVMSRRAQLYVLDEPIGGVDPAARDYILKTIIGNYSPESSVIISTHLINDIEPILDEALFIYKGQIILHDSIDTLRETYHLSMDELFREKFKAQGGINDVL